MRKQTFQRVAGCLLVAAALLAGCGNTQTTPADEAPRPTPDAAIEQQPAYPAPAEQPADGAYPAPTPEE